MSAPQSPPFNAALYRLGAHDGDHGITLVRLDPTQAPMLARALAAIDPWARYPYPASALQAYLAAEEPGAPRFQIMIGTKIAGAIGLRLNWLRGPHLQLLGILPQHQGAGLGGLVLAWLESEARDARNLWLTVSDFNARALAFYARNGFERAAELPDLVRAGCTEILMRKRLPPR